VPKSSDPITIDIQPFDGIPDEAVQYVTKELRQLYSRVTVKPALPLPASAFYAARNRYRADSLINFLNRLALPRHVVIGLTDQDIRCTKNKVADWGVMGLGFCPGQASIASTFRLSKKERLQQLFKVAIHELGHTQGLPHCAVKTCYMRDAEGGNPTDEEKDFCKDCKAVLIKKDWLFN